MRKICKECANYDHKNLKHTKACDNCATEHYKDGTESDPSNWRALPQTNADRLRAMSDEELMQFLFNEVSNNTICSFCTPTMRTKCKCDGHCKNGILEWLKQPADEERDSNATP